MNKFRFFQTCVEWVAPLELLTAIVDNSKQISEATFRRRVCKHDYQSLQLQLGYFLRKMPRNGGLTIKEDYHVAFFRSKVAGEPLYYMQHSAIEYVFRKVNYEN